MASITIVDDKEHVVCDIKDNSGELLVSCLTRGRVPQQIDLVVGTPDKTISLAVNNSTASYTVTLPARSYAVGRLRATVKAGWSSTGTIVSVMGEGVL